MTIWCFAVILLAAGRAGAQTGPDELVQAAQLAAHAQTLEDQCRYRESSDWLEKAIAHLKHFHSANASETGTAGSLLARLEIRREELKHLPALLDRRDQDIARLLSAARTQSASRLLRETMAPACDSRFARLEKEIIRRQATARDLIQEGTESIRREDRKAALRALNHAAALDAEAPGLSEDLEAARSLRSSHRFRNAVLTVFVVGAISAGGYYASQKYPKNVPPEKHP